MTTIQGVDGSYTRLDSAKVAALKGKDIKIWVQCLWTGIETPKYARANLERARSGGLGIAGYISTNGNQSGSYHAIKGMQAIPGSLWDDLWFVATDLELSGISIPHARDMVDAIEGMGGRKIIYTSYNFWTTRFNNTTHFTDCLLWNAYWDNAEDIDFPSLPYGGWKLPQIIGEQYTGGQTVVPGVYVDRDIFIKELAHPEEVDEVELQKQIDTHTQQIKDLRQRDGEILAYSNNIDAAILEKQASILVRLKETQQGLMKTATMLVEHLRADPIVHDRTLLSTLVGQLEAQEKAIDLLEVSLTGLREKLHAATE